MAFATAGAFGSACGAAGAADEAAAGPALTIKPAATARPDIATPRITLFIGITISFRKVISDKLIIGDMWLSAWRHTSTIR
ncbi:hypothetical protein GCM10010443_37040 [Actinoplanes cyaneus]